jgi:uncharacterized protein (TIGR03437 family)
MAHCVTLWNIGSAGTTGGARRTGSDLREWYRAGEYRFGHAQFLKQLSAVAGGFFSAPPIYAGPNQINTIVPYALAGQPQTTVVITGLRVAYVECER